MILPAFVHPSPSLLAGVHLRLIKENAEKAAPTILQQISLALLEMKTVSTL
jgi:hypothetical protein